MRKKIGIDFHVVDGKYQGSRTHVINLFKELIAARDDLEFYLFLENGQSLKSISPVFSAPNVHLIYMPRCNPFKRLFYYLPKLIKEHDIDLLHMQYVLPFPVPQKCKTVVTIHDVLFESHPEYFTKFFVLRSRLLMRLAAIKSDHVFTVSNYCKSELEKYYKLSSQKVSVIYNGVDFDKFNPDVETKNFLVDRKLISNQYIVSIGRLEPRKNHLALIKAYEMIADEHTDPLVIIGQPDFHFQDIFTYIKSSKLLSSKILILSDVSDDELPVLISNAKLFVYPAFAEGFGMPPLEALASGCPVITSNTTALPEVVGDVGFLIDPHDVKSIADQLLYFYSLEQKQVQQLKKSSIDQAKSFSWFKSALIVSGVYNNILG